MIRLPNLLPTQADAATTKRSDAAATAAGQSTTKALTSDPKATQVRAEDTSTASAGRQGIAELRAMFERSAGQDRAIAASDVLLEGLGKQGATLDAMRAVAVEATGADFASAFAAGKGLRDAFGRLETQLDATAQATRTRADLVLGSGPQTNPFGLAATGAVAPPAPEMGPRALGLEGLPFGSKQDAAAAVKALDAAIAKVDAGRKGVFQFREGVSQVAETQRRELYNGGLLRSREEALAKADQVSKSLSQDVGDGQTVGMQLLAQAVPSAQSVLSLLRSE